MNTLKTQTAALSARLHAAELLRNARAQDGLHPFAVLHRHEYGNTAYVVWAAHKPTEDQVIPILEAPFESDRGEELFISPLNTEELAGTAPNSLLEQALATLQEPQPMPQPETAPSVGTAVSPSASSSPASALKTSAGHPVTYDEVAEWVGLHYQVHLGSQPGRLQEWVDRFAAAHSYDDRFASFYIAKSWQHHFGPAVTQVRWAYQVGGEREGLVLAEFQAPGGAWKALTPEDRQHLQESLHENDLFQNDGLNPEFEGSVELSASLPKWAPDEEQRSWPSLLQQALQAMEQYDSVRDGLAQLVGPGEEGQHFVELWHRLKADVQLVRDPRLAEFSEFLQSVETVKDLLAFHAEDYAPVSYSVQELAISTVVGVQCARLFLRTELLIATLVDVSVAPVSAMRHASARQMNVWFHG